MPEITAIIADDEPAARTRLRRLLAGEPDVVLADECATGPSTVSAVRRRSPNLLFLDIEMPGMGGFQVLEALGNDIPPVVVFVTAYDRYAIRAFEAHALDYLLKPFDDERFRATLARVRARLADRAAGRLQDRLRGVLGEVAAAARSSTASDETRNLRHIAVRQRDQITVVEVDRIEWIEAAGDYVRLHIGKQPAPLARHSLGALEEQLDDRFVRVHRSAIVRVDAIQKMFPRTHGDYDLLLRDGTELRVSRSYRTRLAAALGIDL